MVSLFTSQTPVSGDLADGTDSYSMGTYFQSSVAGTVTHIRWYFPASGQPGGVAPKANLFRNSDSLKLGGADAVFAYPGTPAGWNQVALSTPVSIAANTLYCAAIWTPLRYVSSGGGATPWPLTNGELSTPANAGRFASGASGNVEFPASSFNNGAYFVDVVFVPDGASTTPVTSTLTVKWRVYNKVTSSLTTKWRVFQKVTSALTSKWLVYAKVSSSLTSKWRVWSTVATSITGKWRVLARVVTSLTAKWHVLAPPAPEPTISSAYLAMQRTLTEKFIADDPTQIELMPRSRVATGTGGYIYQNGLPRASQTVKMVLLSSDQRPTVTVAGVERVADYHLIGRWDMQIAVGDTWDAEDGTTWEVLGFTEGWDYMTKAFVGRHIPRSVRP